MYKIKSISESEEKRILKIHPFLPGTYVKLLQFTNTRAEGWISTEPDHLIKSNGVVLKVHEDVINAIQVHLFDPQDVRFWHWKDFEIIEIEQEPQIFKFDLAYLDDIIECTG